MDNQVILQLVKAMAEHGCNHKLDYDAFVKLSHLPHLTTQQSILISKRLKRYSEKQLPALAKELGIKFDAEALDHFSKQPVADAPLISIMRYEDKYGPRIALHMPYNREAQDELKQQLPFPRSKFESNIKVWSIIDDEEVIRLAVNILKKHGYDFSTWLLTEEGYGSQKLPSHTKSPSSTFNVSAELKKDKLILRWPFIPDPSLRDEVRLAVKSIPNRKFNYDEKFWTIPLSHGHTLYKELDGLYQPLADAIACIPEVEEYLEDALKRVSLSQAVELDDTALVQSYKEKLQQILPEGKELYPFQYAGLAFAELSEGRCLLGDDMGIGKTIQALAYAALHPEKWPVAVVCPANVKYNWAKEIEEWLPHVTYSVVNTGKEDIQPTDFIIINYDLMRKQVDNLSVMDIKTCIIDESHYLKDANTQRAEATLYLANKCEAVLCLSGTAITNRPIEFFTTLNLLRPTHFSSWFQFAQRYTNAFHNGYGWNFTGASNTKELNERTRDFCIRRLKSEVLTELPPKIRSFVPVIMKPDERKEYKQSRLDWMRKYESYQTSGGMPKGFVLNMLTDLRHTCGKMKVSSAVDWMREHRYQTGKPLVVYTHHKDVMDELCAHMDEEEPKFTYRRIAGDTPSNKRAENVETFQRGELDVIVCSTVAAKEGITLTAADTVLFLEREWVPGWEEQAEDRVLRIGQDSDKVHAVYLSCAGTIDEHFDRIIEEKRAVVQAVLDGGEAEERAGIVSALLKKIQDNEGVLGV